jgi:hypothetical protein
MVVAETYVLELGGGSHPEHICPMPPPILVHSRGIPLRPAECHAWRQILSIVQLHSCSLRTPHPPQAKTDYDLEWMCLTIGPSRSTMVDVCRWTRVRTQQYRGLWVSEAVITYKLRLRSNRSSGCVPILVCTLAIQEQGSTIWYM